MSIKKGGKMIINVTHCAPYEKTDNTELGCPFFNKTFSYGECGELDESFCTISDAKICYPLYPKIYPEHINFNPSGCPLLNNEIKVLLKNI